MRRVVGAALLALLVVTASAYADHSNTELASIGPVGGQGAWGAGFLGSSGDGRRIFISTLEQLTADDTDSTTDTYERFDGATTLVTPGTAFNTRDFRVSADGSRVFFTSAEALAPDDTDGSGRDVYERSGGTYTLLSGGPTGNSDPSEAALMAITPDGSAAVIGTFARLTGGDTDDRRDIYLRRNGATELVSTGPAGGNGPFDACGEPLVPGPNCFGRPLVSADGERVFFETEDALTSQDADSQRDVYERSGGTTMQVSTGPNGGSSVNPSILGGISDDGSRAFVTTADALIATDTDTQSDVYERSGSTLTLVSTGPGDAGSANGEFVAASEDGRRVLFKSNFPLTVEDLDADVDLYERFGGATTLISRDVTGSGWGVEHVTPDGQHVLFVTSQSLTPADDDSGGIQQSCNPGCPDVYEWFGGTTTFVSTGPAEDTGPHWYADFTDASRDGARILFTTAQAMTATDTDGTRIDTYERFDGATTLLTVGITGGDPAHAAGGRFAAEDGTVAAVVTPERLLPNDTDSSGDVYLRTLADTSGYPRPKGATPFRVPLVPAEGACAAPNRTHGPPLAFPSCSPPQPASANLTIGVGDGSPALARSTGFVRLEVLVGVPGPPDDSDVNLRVNLTNVMRASDLSEYTGELRAELTVRRTGRDSTQIGSTSVDFPFAFTVPCAPTPGSSLDASTCDALTSANAVVPGAITDGRRAIWALERVRIYDGGPDEDGDTEGDNSLFMTQGVFVP